jgi:hypothetical protein
MIKEINSLSLQGLTNHKNPCAKFTTDKEPSHQTNDLYISKSAINKVWTTHPPKSSITKNHTRSKGMAMIPVCIPIAEDKIYR